MSNDDTGNTTDIDELRADIARKREDLGETASELAAKADVKARARKSLEQTKQQVKQNTADTAVKVRQSAVDLAQRTRNSARSTQQQVAARPVPVAIVAAVLSAAAVAAVLFARGRR